MATTPGAAAPRRSAPTQTPVSLRANSQLTSAAVDTPASPSPRHSTNPPEGSRVEYLESPAAPIAKPTFRLQDGEIILEDAAAAAPPAAAPDRHHSLHRHQLTQQQQPLAPSGHGGEGRTYTRERELLALASRSTTIQAQASHKHLGLSHAAADAVAAANRGEARVYHVPAPEGGGGVGDHDAPGGSSEQASRMRYKPTLTQENVQHVTKLEQYSARPDPTERMWRWLEDAGPPYEGSPSVGVPSKAVPATDAQGTARGKQSGKRCWLCSCFGGGGSGGAR